MLNYVSAADNEVNHGEDKTSFFLTALFMKKHGIDERLHFVKKSC